MKQQLRCYEAEVCDLYEAKHTLTSPCAEGTLHRRSRLHFSCTVRCASFAPQFVREIIKNAPKNRSICLIKCCTKFAAKSHQRLTPIQLGKLEFDYHLFFLLCIGKVITNTHHDREQYTSYSKYNP